MLVFRDCSFRRCLSKLKVKNAYQLPGNPLFY